MNDYVEVAGAEDALDEGDAMLAEAWPRFWARIIDINWLSFVAGTLVGILWPSVFYWPIMQGPFGGILLVIATLPLIMAMDAVIIHFFGTNFGKWIAGIAVRRMDGGYPKMEQSLLRNLHLAIRGLGLNIPIINLIAYIQGYSAVNNDGYTYWDEETDTRVIVTNDNPIRLVLAAIIGIGFFALDRLLAFAGL